MADATDNAQKRADELGVNLEDVEGTGQDGRVIVSDVEAFAKEPASETPVAAPEVRAVLNRATGLGGYGFDDGFSVLPHQRYTLSEDEYKQYSKARHNNHQVLIKA